MGLSVTIITKNEENNLPRCLESVSWADEIILVDCHSTDKTCEIASKYTDKVFVREFTGFSDQKSFALDQASQEWVLNLDADEVLSPELQTEIREVTGSDRDEAGFRIPRITFYLGRPIKHCGWYPDYQLRLFRKCQANYAPRLVHESVQVDGKLGYLKNDMLHYSYTTFRHHLEKQRHYALASAVQMHIDGKKCGLVKMAIYPLFSFFKKYILARGFQDGVEGFLISSMYACYVFTKYAALWDLQRSKPTAGELTEKG